MIGMIIAIIAGVCISVGITTIRERKLEKALEREMERRHEDEISN